MREKIIGEKKGVMLVLALAFALLLANGVYAYTFEMSDIPASVQKGEIVSLSFSASPGEGETLAELDKFGYFTFYLSGPAYFGDYCSFFPNGTLRYECIEMEIEKLSNISCIYWNDSCDGENGECSPDVGGCGGAANVSSYNYSVKINTSQYVAGEYYLYVTSRIGYNYYFVGEAEFNITAENLPMKACSVRASGGQSGEIYIDGEQEIITGNNKLNFNIVFKNNVAKGSGYLISQYGRSRFNYKFKVARVLENNNDAAVIAVGYGWGDYVGENSLIFLDKKNNLASMRGMWPEVENMGVGLMRGC